MIQKLKEWSGVIALIAIIVLLSLPYFGSKVKFGTTAPTGTISYFTAIASQYGLYVGTYGSATQIIDDAGNFLSAITGTTATFSGLVKPQGGLTLSYTNSTSTLVATQTLIASDVANYSTIVFTPNKGNTTLTLPASSTLSAFIPTAGDTAVQCWYNATSTANTTITFAAGTGIDLEVASSTSGTQGALSTNLSINSGNSGCFRFIRKPATATAFDIVAQFTSFVDGD